MTEEQLKEIEKGLEVGRLDKSIFDIIPELIAEARAQSSEIASLRELLREAMDSVVADIHCSENCYSVNPKEQKELLQRIDEALTEKK